MEDVRTLSDEMVIALLDNRVKFEAANEAEIIDFIREVILRKLYLNYGASSIFDFLTRAHCHYAPSVAQRKLDSARLMQDFPEVKEWLFAEDINPTQLGMLAQCLRQKPLELERQREILESMRGQTIANTQIILNEAFEIKVKKRQKIRVQRDGSVRAEVTFSKEQWEIIERAREVLSHSVPDGDLDKVLTYCANFTLSKKDPAASSLREVQPHQNKGISRTARRHIFQRDKCCQHRHPDGSICGSKFQLQVDHVIARWKGGSDNVENLQLLCGAHNRSKYEREVSADSA